MKEYKEPKKITVSQLIEILKSCEPDAVVLNGKEENIRIYPGKYAAPADGSVVMIC